MKMGQGEQLCRSGKVQTEVGPSPAPLGSVSPEATSKGHFGCALARAWRPRTRAAVAVLPAAAVRRPPALPSGPSRPGLCPCETRLGSKRNLLLESPC